jgi:hypothetical protein
MKPARISDDEGAEMGNTSLIRTALLIALLTAFGFAATGRAPAADRSAPAAEPRPPVVTVVGREASSQDVLGDPNCANAVIRYRHAQARRDPPDGREHHAEGKRANSEYRG